MGNIKIESLEDLRALIITAKGGDPKAQQSLNAFLNFKNDIERSNFPQRSDLQLIAYANYAYKTLFNGEPNNPYDKLEKCLAAVFMGYKSEKSHQFVEMTKQTPSLVNLETAQGSIKRSVMDRITGRNKPA